MRSLVLKQSFLSIFVAGFVLGVVFLLSNFAYAIPECSEEYSLTSVENDNFTPIDTDNGKDCIVIGNNNTANINSGNGGDIIIVGDNNSGSISGGNGADIIFIGNGNLGDVFGNNGDDDITLGCGNTGSVDGLFKIIPCPVFVNIISGTYTSVQSVSLSSLDSTSIRYTLDGTNPTCSPSATGALYELPISISSTKTIIAVGCSGDNSSVITSFGYTIELKTDSAGLSSVLEAVFAPASGESISLTQSLTLTQDLEINTTASGSKVVLSEATVITRADTQAFDASTLVSSETAVSSLAGLTEGQIVEAALQWGIPSVTLEFSPAIAISIFVGDSFNGQTLNVNRSVTGVDGWTTDGIVPPATCLVVGGICSFQATKASVYAAITVPPPAPASVPSLGGGGGTIWFPALYNPVSNTTPIPVLNDVKPTESPVPTPLLSTPAPVIKIALAPKPKIVVAKNIQKEIVPEKNNEVATISTAVSENLKKSFVLSLFASVGRLFSYSFSFWK